MRGREESDGSKVGRTVALSRLLFSFGGFAHTPAGRQCPSAKVQMEYAAVKGKCGCVVGSVLRVMGEEE